MSINHKTWNLADTRQGATSFVMVMFFTMMAGIITVGFISIMLSNIMQSTNYDLSQSAYDSAVAGIEDAKIMLLKYNNCVVHASSSINGCSKVIEVMSRSDAEDNCNVVGEALGRTNITEQSSETPIQSTYGSTSGVSSTSSTLDQAYTCVKVDTTVDEYLGTITTTSDFKVIPLRTSFSADTSVVSPVKFIRVQWFNSEDLKNVSGTGISQIYKSSSNIFTSTKQLGDRARNIFGTTNTYVPAIQLGLAQASTQGYILSDFEKSIDANSNRGTLVINSVQSNGGRTAVAIPNSATSGFAGSAVSGSEDWGSGLNAVNSPITATCDTTALASVQYACEAIIGLPGGIFKGRKDNNVSDIMRYLTITTPYEGVNVSFSIQMYGGSSCALNGNSLTNCEIKQFSGVQSSVDSTGRANDLFRRVEARVELIDVNYPFPKYALSVYCTAYNNDGSCADGSEGNIEKKYWASYNCFTLINGVDKGCGEGGSYGRNFNNNATAGF